MSFLPNLIPCASAAIGLAWPSLAWSAEIVAAEYYLNGDPGPGNGVPISGFDPTEKASLQLDLPVATIAALSPGMHRITVRFQDADGDWSEAFTREFLREDLNTPQASTPLATAAEYYINGDPGPGNGISITLPAGKWDHSVVIDVPPARIAALAPGVHWITGRVKNTNGDWSVAFTRAFLKEDLATPPNALASHIEYQWYLAGIAVGPPVRLAPDAPAQTIQFSLLASLQGLSDGVTYHLVATPYDTLGNPGMPATARVTIETTDSDGDGLPDLWESQNGLNPALATDGTTDVDGDGLSNHSEFIAKTDPNKADTSGDGINDKLAIDLGLDPLKSHPSIQATLATLSNATGTPTAEQVRALYPNTPVLTRNAQTGKFDLRVGIQHALQPGDWQKLPVNAAETRVEDGELIFSFSAPDPARFYRVGAGE